MNKYHLSLLAAFTVSSSNAAIVYEEFVLADPDLSGVFSSPTMIVMATGDNTILADIGNNGESGAVDADGNPLLLDADFFSISVPTDHSLTAITVDEYFSQSPANSQSFIAYTSGLAFTGQTLSDVDGWNLFDDSSGNIITSLTGSTSLPSGDYSFWVQETFSTEILYTLNFTLTAIPEPTAFGLLTLSSLGFVFRRKRVEVAL